MKRSFLIKSGSIISKPWSAVKVLPWFCAFWNILGNNYQSSLREYIGSAWVEQ
jgi:hypothetical protein